jgi:hypothetical protein
LGAIFTAVCTFDVVAPPMSSGIVEALRSISLATCTHLVERRRDEAREADDVDACSRAVLEDLLRRAPSRPGR